MEDNKGWHGGYFSFLSFCVYCGFYYYICFIHPLTEKMMTLMLNHKTHRNDLSRCMGKPTICIGENKVTAKLTSAFVFATWIVQFLYFLNPKFPASYHLL